MFVVFNKETTRTLNVKYGQTKYFKSERAAKSMITRLKNSKENSPFDAFAEANDFFSNIEKTVVRKNFMTGKEFNEPVNTPYYASPSSETYWSS